jgi:asparagine synthase (glutamine-hydrolysing)
MCGICGMVWLQGGSASPVPPFDLSPMLESLAHRGPQGAGLSHSGTAVFGAQRLAIRGLADDPQPIVDPTTGVIVVCNGEIDNHLELREWLCQRGRPVTQATDVAVLPGLYLELGASFVEKLTGVFAIALWDPRSEKLILVRDRAGEKPLFYQRMDQVVRFATEVAALAAGIPEELIIDRNAIAVYLQRGCFTAPSSPLLSIRKVQPGEIITISSGAMRQRRYWRWPIVETAKRRPSLAVFDEIFRAAVCRQSSVDVPFGMFISGGLDSSLIAAVTRDVHPSQRPPCYTLRFAEASYDEGIFAQSVAEMLKLEMISVQVDPEMLIKELPLLVRMTGEPLGDPAWIPTALLAQRAARDVRIVFSGEGGDELFGGYPTYLGANLAKYYDRAPAFVRATIAAAAKSLPNSKKKMPLSFLLKRFVSGGGLSPFARHLIWTANLGPELMTRLGVTWPLESQADHPNVLLDLLQRHDLETTLAEGLLTKSDRGGMSASLEIRSPFLDREVMEFAASLPASERVHGLTTKCFLKRYARKYLPPAIIHRRKRGLSVPLASWLPGPLYSWALEKLRSGRLEKAGIAISPTLAILEEHRRRQADHARALWALLVLDEWLDWMLERNSQTAYADQGSDSSVAMLKARNKEFGNHPI